MRNTFIILQKFLALRWHSAILQTMKVTLKIRFGSETVTLRVTRNDAAVNAAVERESRKRNTLPDFVEIL